MLGELTLSMLEGEKGQQAKELEKLVEWLEEILQPDIVHLSFSLFAGFARRIKERLGSAGRLLAARGRSLPQRAAGALPLEGAPDPT